jgi:hypothetical protein
MEATSARLRPSLMTSRQRWIKAGDRSAATRYTRVADTVLGKLGEALG